jgi:hypothetical protein
MTLPGAAALAVAGRRPGTGPAVFWVVALAHSYGARLAGIGDWIESAGNANDVE